MIDVRGTGLISFFKNFDEVVARLNRATFAMVLTVGFVAAAFAFDADNNNDFSKADWFQLWPMEQLVFRLCIICAGVIYVASVVQLCGVIAKIFEATASLNPGWLGNIFASIGALVVVLIGIVFTAFTLVGLAKPEYRILGG